MIRSRRPAQPLSKAALGLWLLLLALALTTMLYWPGLSGDFVLDDYPNIVQNPYVQPHDASAAALLNAALSSPASQFRRPLASLSFAANYLATGLDPYWMKLTNLLIHLLNGCLVYLLSRQLLQAVQGRSGQGAVAGVAGWKRSRRAGAVAALIAFGWLVLPINLTAVLYVVQRMESMANAFVLLGLLGYVVGRRRMLERSPSQLSARAPWPGFLLCAASITVPALLGALAKETAIMLPLYAFLVEWALFGFARAGGGRDMSLLGLFFLVLVLPMFAGGAWLLQLALNPTTWQNRDFTLATRLLTEARVVVDYIAWTLLPTPHALSFYHDDFPISASLFAPWTTLACLLLLGGMAAIAWRIRARAPLVALGLALFLGAQLLTGTIIPLELVYEHRNYFASFGLLLALVPLLAPAKDAEFAMLRRTLLAALALYWCVLTSLTAYSWGNSMRLADELARRAPASWRAQYELGRAIYTHYDPSLPLTLIPRAQEAFEKAARLPGSSILPEQAIILLSANLHLPGDDQWWQRLIGKLKAHAAGSEDESALGMLTQCMYAKTCDLPAQPVSEAFLAALSHPHPSPGLLAKYSYFAWNILHDRALGVRMANAAVDAAPADPGHRILLIQMLIMLRQPAEAERQLAALRQLNTDGRLDLALDQLQQGLRSIEAAPAPSAVP
jgi:hypothetical protein